MATPKKVSRRDFAEFAGVRWNAMIELCGLSKIDSLSPIQRAAHLAYWYMSEVYNGGHFQYFVNQSVLNHSEVISALRAVGATEQASVLAKAVRAPAIRSIRFPQTAQAYLRAEQEADLSEFDKAFGRCSRKIETCLQDFLDKHESEF